MGLEHDHGETSTRRLYWATFINLLLTVFQVVGGLMSGSLSLLADALHNLSDAGALGIAAVAAKIAKIPPNERMTYGYRRAEILGALINSTTLILVGIYLIYESINRYYEQNPIDGWTVIVVASIALVIDIATAMLMHAGSKKNINFKAAFVHNVSDALASVVVIVSGVIILNYQVYIVDLVATLLISIYVLYQAFPLIKKCILILMQSTPPDIDLEDVKKTIESTNHVQEAHHIHVWQLDDNHMLLEGHVKIDPEDISFLEEIKTEIRSKLKTSYSIEHSTLEIESSQTCPNR